MVRIVASSSALLLAASAFTLSNAHLQYKVRVRNLTYKQPFSAINMFAHTEELQAFQAGEIASPELRTLAEDGDFSDFLALADDKDIAPFLCGFMMGSEPLSPGDQEWFTLEVDEEKCPDYVMFSMVSMLVNTNDAFMGIDSLRWETGSDIEGTAYVTAYDAGTEENNELCSHIPGPACSDTKGNEEAGPGEGFVHYHRGMHGVGDLSAADYDWRTPVAEVYLISSNSD